MALPKPLKPLKRYQTRTLLELQRSLRKVQREIKAAIVLATQQANLATSAAERERLFREIEARYGTYAKGVDLHMRALTGEIGEQAHREAQAMLGKGRLLQYDPERNERYWATIHPTNGKNLAAVFTEQMTQQAIGQLRSAYVDTLRLATLNGSTANETQKALRDRWDSLASDGNLYRFRDRSGRAWENARYLQMLVRTNAQRVAHESRFDTWAEHGVRFVRISPEITSDCKVCAAWAGQILQMAGRSRKFPTYEEARAAGMFHPNCTHMLLPMDETVDAEALRAQGELRKPTEEQMADSDYMAQHRERAEIARHRARGLSEADALREVTREQLAVALRVGLVSDEAARAADLLTAEQLDALRASGIPRFDPVRKGETPGETWRGHLLIPREAGAEEVLRYMGIRPDPSAQPPEGKPEPPKPEPPAWPDDPDRVRVVRSLGGSTGAELVEDDWGRRYVRKRGGTAGGDAAGHLRSEAAADMAYSALGARVPEVWLYERDGMPPVKLSRFVEGVSLGEYLDRASAADRGRVLDEIRKDFDIDVLFGNRDVIGMSRDNILVDAEGNPWRIDNGASFKWRAQGGVKNDWSKWPDELWSMREAQINKGVFDGVSVIDTAIASRSRDYEAIKNFIPEGERQVVQGRLEELQQLGGRAQGFRDGGYVDTHTEPMLAASYGLSKEGFRESVPRSVTRNDFGYFRTDKRAPTAGSTGPGGLPADWQNKIITAAKSINYHAGKGDAANQASVQAAVDMAPQLKALVQRKASGAQYWLEAVTDIGKANKKLGATLPHFDAAIGITEAAQAQQAPAPSYSSLTAHIHDYMRRNGANPQLVANWQGGQANDSWSKNATAWKATQATVRPHSETFTGFHAHQKKSYEEALRVITKDTAQAKELRQAMAMYDAAVQLTLENTSFAYNDRDRRIVTLIRTERDGVVRLKGQSVKNYTAGSLQSISFAKGACESHSIFHPVKVNGNQVTVVEVPYALIKGMFFFERTPGGGGSAYCGDGENEFTVDGRGCKTAYVGTYAGTAPLAKQIYDDFYNMR